VLTLDEEILGQPVILESTESNTCPSLIRARMNFHTSPLCRGCLAARQMRKAPWEVSILPLRRHEPNHMFIKCPPSILQSCCISLQGC